MINKFILEGFVNKVEGNIISFEAMVPNQNNMEMSMTFSDEIIEQTKSYLENGRVIIYVEGFLFPQNKSVNFATQNVSLTSIKDVMLS